MWQIGYLKPGFGFKFWKCHGELGLEANWARILLNSLPSFVTFHEFFSSWSTPKMMRNLGKIIKLWHKIDKKMKESLVQFALISFSWPISDTQKLHLRNMIVRISDYRKLSMYLKMYLCFCKDDEDTSFVWIKLWIDFENPRAFMLRDVKVTHLFTFDDSILAQFI